MSWDEHIRTACSQRSALSTSEGHLWTIVSVNEAAVLGN
jgi:hypothetical protein